jgi:acylphosphatase
MRGRRGMAESLDNRRIRLKIEGRVQGVFFRASAAEAAIRLGVKGWVKNLRDGSVEIMAEGKKEELDAFIAWCRQGPPRAQVENVHVRQETFLGEFRDFRVVG